MHPRDPLLHLIEWKGQCTRRTTNLGTAIARKYIEMITRNELSAKKS